MKINDSAGTIVINMESESDFRNLRKGLNNGHKDAVILSKFPEALEVSNTIKTKYSNNGKISKNIMVKHGSDSYFLKRP
jgi:hypothetical protein